MILYLTKLTICAALLLMIYCLFLEKEKMLRFKRYYLLFSLLFSMGIPFVSIKVASPVLVEYEKSVAAVVANNIIEDEVEWQEGFIEGEASTFVTVVKDIVLMLFVVISGLLLLRFCFNIFRLLLIAHKNEIVEYKGVKLVLVKHAEVPHSFLHYIFVSEAEYKCGMIEDEILTHELTHAKQRHSLDILLVELLLVFFWFNPILYIYRSKIRLNHEFLADEKVVEGGVYVPSYQQILLNKISIKSKLSLASNFNYLITKKRLIMMTKTTSKGGAYCRKAATIFALAIAFYIFSGKTFAENIENLLPIPAPGGVAEQIIVPNSGISEAQMKEYREIVGKYGYVDENDKIVWKSMELSREDLNILYPYYIQMTDEQRYSKLLVSFRGPLRIRPNRLRAPNRDEWNGCRSPKNVKIWVDDKLVTQDEINKYNRHDFVFFINRIPMKGDEKQSYLWTKKGYDEYKAKYEKGIPVSELLKIAPNVWFQTSFAKPDRSMAK